MSYQIEKIRDLLAVPIDRREACVRELLYGLELHELTYGNDAQNVLFGSMLWTDDDGHSVSLCDPGGTAILSLKITKDAP